MRHMTMAAIALAACTTAQDIQKANPWTTLLAPFVKSSEFELMPGSKAYIALDQGHAIKKRFGPVHARSLSNILGFIASRTKVGDVKAEVRNGALAFDAKDKATRELLARVLQILAPPTKLEVQVYEKIPFPPPTIIKPGHLQRVLSSKPKYQKSTSTRSAGTARFTFGKQGKRLILTVQPHPLATKDHTALFVEFVDERGNERIAGTAAGVIQGKGALAITLGDRVIVVTAQSESAASKHMVSIPWSFLASYSLREEVQIHDGKPDELTNHEPSAILTRGACLDLVRSEVRPRQWDETLVASSTHSHLVVYGTKIEGLEKSVADLLARQERAWIENAELKVDFRSSTETNRTKEVHIPVLPGREVSLSCTTVSKPGSVVSLDWTLDNHGMRVTSGKFNETISDTKSSTKRPQPGVTKLLDLDHISVEIRRSDKKTKDR